VKGPVWNCGRHAVPRELNYSVDAANSSTMPGIYTERMSAFNILNITTIQSVESKIFVSNFFVGAILFVGAMCDSFVLLAYTMRFIELVPIDRD
jgi:hypothetical protein